MTAVSNSSVLIALGSVDLLILLREKCPEGVVIPDAVWREVVEEGGNRPGAREVAAAPWIARQAPRDQRLVRLLRMELDAGEAEAIALAHEIGASVVLLDEKDARRVAERLGLRVVGTVGILVWAKRVGKIESLKQVREALDQQARFRLSDALWDRALREVGESS